LLLVTIRMNTENNKLQTHRLNAYISALTVLLVTVSIFPIFLAQLGFTKVLIKKKLKCMRPKKAKEGDEGRDRSEGIEGEVERGKEEEKINERVKMRKS